MEMIAIDAQSLTVRDIALDDANSVAELSGQLGYKASTAEITSRIQALLPLHQGHAVLVACANNQVVGWIEAEIVRHLQSSPHVLITGLIVKEEVRSLGVGKRLCADVEQWAIRQGVSIVRVTSRSTREGAHRFYLREGFTHTKTSLVFEKVLA
jgi:GNAT superfamily N-acetyltransferase